MSGNWNCESCGTPITKDQRAIIRVVKYNAGFYCDPCFDRLFPNKWEWEDSPTFFNTDEHVQ